MKVDDVIVLEGISHLWRCKVCRNYLIIRSYDNVYVEHTTEQVNKFFEDFGIIGRPNILAFFEKVFGYVDMEDPKMFPELDRDGLSGVDKFVKHLIDNKGEHCKFRNVDSELLL